MPNLPNSITSVIKLVFLLTFVGQSQSQGLIDSIKSILRLGHRSSYDRRKCQTRPSTVYGHFISSEIYPNEIHKFYISRSSPRSKKTLGHHLKPVKRRIVSIDLTHSIRQGPWVIYKAVVCIPNETTLVPSYE
jgi:hypothetical protein